MRRIVLAAVLGAVMGGCMDFDGAYDRCVESGACGGGGGGKDSGTEQNDSGPPLDGGTQSDAGAQSDAGTQADGGTQLDAGAQPDAGAVDSGTTGGVDAGDPLRACLLASCTRGTWCTERTNPGGPVLYGIWAHSPCNVWAGGTQGTVARFDGAAWTVNSNLFAGKSIFAVQGRAANDVWLIGQTGLVRRWNGNTYLDLSLAGVANLFGLAARFAPTRVVGPSSTFLVETDAGMLVQEPGTTLSQQYGLFQTTPNDVWAVGVGGSIRHFDGGSPWTRMTVPTADESKTFSGVFGTSPTDVWFAGDNSFLHWDGGSFASYPPPRPDFINAMWGASRDEIWAVGEKGTVLHWSGGPTWSVVDAGVAVDLTAVTGYSDGGQLDVWVTGPDELILHYRR